MKCNRCSEKVLLPLLLLLLNENLLKYFQYYTIDTFHFPYYFTPMKNSFTEKTMLGECV